MAITVAFDGQLMHDMGDADTTTGVANASDGGAGAAPSANPDFFYEGSNSIGKKVGTARAGIEADCSAFGTPRLVDVTAANRALIFMKLQATNKAALLAYGSPSMHIQFGSGGAHGNNSQVEIAGNEAEFYPVLGGFLLNAINLNLAAFQSDDTGTPGLTVVNYFAMLCDFGGTSKDDNVMMDAIYAGRGLTLIGSSPDGTMLDFLAFDQETAGERQGCFRSQDDVITVFGMHWFGRDATPTTTLTVYQDSNRNIVFPDGLFGPGDAGFSFDLGNASTDIDLNSYIVTGVGRRNRARWNTEDDVNATPDEITLQSVIDAFRPADAVIARSQGGTETPGLTDGTRYWVGKDMTATPTGLTLHTSRDDAALHSGGGGGGTPVALTASGAGNGEIWRLDKDNDTRPQLLGTGTAGAFDVLGGTFTEIGKLTLTAAMTVKDAIFNNPFDWITDGGQVDGVTINKHATIEGESFVVCDDLDDIFDATFDNASGRGFGIESTVVANDALVGVTFIGYGGSLTLTDHEFDATATGVDVSTEQITMDSGDAFATGDAVYYTRRLTANTIVTGLTEGTVYYAARISAGVYTLHLNEGDAINGNAAINLTVVGSGTHSLYSANAAVFFSGGGTQTLSITGGTTPTYAAVLDSVITRVSSITVTFTPLIAGSDVSVFATGTNVPLQSTDSSGTSFGAAIGSGQAVDYKIYAKGYQVIEVFNVSFVASQDVIINQQADPNYDEVN